MDNKKYSRRRSALAAELMRKGLSAVIVSDFENGRDSSLRYLCGQPSDALLVVNKNATSVLIAWDVNMAHRMGDSNHILPFTDFGRQSAQALKAALDLLGLEKGSKIALPASTPYPEYIELVQSLDAFDLICEKTASIGL